MNKDSNKKLGFTLAEVLITLAIIGVVAALTIPTLINKYQEKKTVTQLFKVYSTLSHAYQMMIAEHGTIDTWGLTNTDTGEVDPETGKAIYDHSAQKLIATRLKKYLKVSKTCKLNEICVNRPYYTMNGLKLGDYEMIKSTSDSPPEANFFLNDGTYIGLGWFSKYAKVVAINIILDGKDATLGKNRFYFQGTTNGIRPEGGDTFYTYCNRNDTSTQAGRYCAEWVIKNKNMDYLHCDNLSWDGARSCKEAEGKKP